MTEYAKRDIAELDEDGGHYWRHVNAMTRESLHSKSDIAAELAYRDSKIGMLLAENARLEHDCAQFYQCFRSATDPEVNFDDTDVMRVMDNMSDAANGDPRRHNDLLPWPRG